MRRPIFCAYNGHMATERLRHTRTTKVAIPAAEVDPEILDGLKLILRAGLPITHLSAPKHLLALKATKARAVDPDLPAARITALDKLMRQQLKRLDREDLREGAELLFGARATRGLPLGERRTAAARTTGYNASHFRKHIEPQILDLLAWQLAREEVNYTARGRKQPPAEISGDTPSITDADLSDPETADHQILLSRIWSAVYGLRAELIAKERWREINGMATEFAEAEEASLHQLGRLLTYLDAYIDKYGAAILHGEAEHNAEALIRLAGWTGEVTRSQAQELRLRFRKRRTLDDARSP